jgi:hypothetical protein
MRSATLNEKLSAAPRPEVQDRTTPPMRRFAWKTGAFPGRDRDRGERVGATVMAFRSENRSGGVALPHWLTDVDTDDPRPVPIPVPPGRYVVACPGHHQSVDAATSPLRPSDPRRIATSRGRLTWRCSRAAAREVL